MERKKQWVEEREFRQTRTSGREEEDERRWRMAGGLDNIRGKGKGKDGQEVESNDSGWLINFIRLDLLRRVIHHMAFDPSFLRFFLPPAGRPARPLIPILAPFHPSHAVLPRREIAISRWGEGGTDRFRRRRRDDKMPANCQRVTKP